MYKKVPPKPLGVNSTFEMIDCQCIFDYNVSELIPSNILFLFQFMDKKVPKNEKFSHVPARLNTGLTVNKVKFVTAQEFARRRNEIFFRLSRGQLYELYSEYEATENESIADSRAFGGESSPPKIVTYSEYSEPLNFKPYLILDVREPEEFCACHLLHARSFPFTMMRRDQMHPEFYNFRNKEETLIIIYCDDERISRDAAKLFVDRGTDNIFLLSGGLHEFAAEYPAFVEGQLPESATPRKGSSSTGRRTGRF
jgi:centrosomal protein CEP41